MTIRLQSKSNPLDAVEMVHLETRLHLTLPKGYREFLFINNDAVPEPNIYKEGTLTTAIAQFFGVSKDPRRDLIAQNDAYAGRLPAGMLAIASAAGGNLICLDLKEGDVHFWDHEGEAIEDETPSFDNMTRLAASFSEFLEKLEPHDPKVDSSPASVIWKSPDFDQKFKPYLETKPAEQIQAELKRLTAESGAGEKPGGVGTVRFSVTCSTVAANDVLTKAKSVLMSLDSGKEPPSWFSEACAPAMSKKQAEEWLAHWRSLAPEAQTKAEAEKRWDLDAWLHWMEPQNRKWFWWDAKELNGSSMTVALVVTEWPFPWGAFGWLLKAAGADSVREKGE